MRKNLRSRAIPKKLRGHILVNHVGLPRYWPIVWESLHAGKLSSTTVSKKLLAIDRFYRFVFERTGKDCLDDLLSQCDYTVIEPLLEAYFVHLRNVAGSAKSTQNFPWQTVLAFIKDILLRNGAQDSVTNRLNAHIRRLDQLYQSLYLGSQAKRSSVRALPPQVLDELFDIVDPRSPSNPFRNDRAKWRNLALFSLFLFQGLRRSEALILPIDAIRSEVSSNGDQTLYWLNIVDNHYEPDEERSLAPSIKTTDSVRQIPISKELVDIIDFYGQNYRGPQDHTFLFSSSRQKPLSHPSVDLIFSCLTDCLSAKAKSELVQKGFPKRITPHSLRHTCAVSRLSQFIDNGEEMEIALQKLRSFFGWSRTSEMPRHYARAYFEDRLKNHWANNFDERSRLLRSLPRSYP